VVAYSTAVGSVTAGAADADDIVAARMARIVDLSMAIYGWRILFGGSFFKLLRNAAKELIV